MCSTAPLPPSLPPQSAAFAVVTNLPMDAQSAQLHKVEEVSLQDGQLQITDRRADWISPQTRTPLFLLTAPTPLLRWRMSSPAGR